MHIYLTILFLASLAFPFFGAANLRSGASPEQSSRAAQTQDEPPMFVLQVGISNYVNYPKLAGVADVLKMRELLTGEAYKVPRANIKTLCDDGVYKSLDGATVEKCDGAATKKSIVESFETHLIGKAEDYYKKTGKQAVVLFEFSGHGSQAPDKNGDERDDKLDETLVTWDSSDAPGKNFDISDDEIYKLTKRLSQYTDNIVYIIDSCHSGSGTRGSDESRSVPARANPVVELAEKNASNTRGETAAEKKIETDQTQTDLLPASDNYIVISAAQAGQRAGQKNFYPSKEAKKPLVYGFLTFYLMEELRNATATTSYRDVMENVRRKVSAERQSQTPQIEGSDNRIVFKGLSKVKNPGIKILEASGKKVFIEAGLMQGVAIGSILEIRSVADEKIATAKVVEAVADKATAEVIEITSGAGVIVSPTRPISAADKDRAILVSPDLGAARIKFLAGGDDDAKLNARDKQIIENVRRSFAVVGGVADKRGVDLATGKWNDKDGNWDIALLKDRFDKVFADRSRVAPIKDAADSTASEAAYKKLPAGDKEIFYLAGKDFVPLYGFYAEAESPDAALRIENAVGQIARLRSLKAVANNKSRLKGKVTIKPFRFKLDENSPCAGDNGAIKFLEKEYVKLDERSKNYKFDLGDKFGLEVVNTSDVPLYIAALNIGADGSVALLSPRDIDPEKDGGVVLAARTGKKILYDDKCRDGAPEYLETGLPSGVETYKVIATTTPTKRKNFEFLQMNSINGLRDDGISLAAVADWTTAEVDFEISSKRRNPQ